MLRIWLICAVSGSLSAASRKASPYPMREEMLSSSPFWEMAVPSALMDGKSSLSRAAAAASMFCRRTVVSSVLVPVSVSDAGDAVSAEGLFSPSMELMSVKSELFLPAWADGCRLLPANIFRHRRSGRRRSLRQWGFLGWAQAVSHSRMARVVSCPSMPGIWMSVNTRSYCPFLKSSNPSAPF